MSSTGQKVGAGAVAVAVLGVIAGTLTFLDNHWSGTFGGGDGDSTRAVVEGTTRSSGVPDGAVTPELPDLNTVDPDIFLSRDQVPVDGTVNVSGEGFAPNEPVVIKIGTFEVARPTANKQGGFSNVQVKIPDFYRNFQKPMTVGVRATSKPDFQYNAERDLVVT